MSGHVVATLVPFPNRLFFSVVIGDDDNRDFLAVLAPPK